MLALVMLLAAAVWLGGRRLRRDALVAVEDASSREGLSMRRP